MFRDRSPRQNLSLRKFCPRRHPAHHHNLRHRRHPARRRHPAHRHNHLPRNPCRRSLCLRSPSHHPNPDNLCPFSRISRTVRPFSTIIRPKPGRTGGTICSTDPIPETAVPTVIVNTTNEPVTPGKFQPTWDSLHQYQCPEWFRNAKFGIWACFGPQNEPEDGDWYARNMYVQGSAQNKFHVANYGPPSQFGFKDVIQVCKGVSPWL